jgi:hypothetical protein
MRMICMILVWRDWSYTKFGREYEYFILTFQLADIHEAKGPSDITIFKMDTKNTVTIFYPVDIYWYLRITQYTTET